MFRGSFFALFPKAILKSWMDLLKAMNYFFATSFDVGKIPSFQHLVVLLKNKTSQKLL
jgi:hypothetical protein